MNEIKARIDGRDVFAKAEFVKGVLWMHVNGRTLMFDPKTKSRRHGKKSEGAGGGDIEAPMPGKVTKIFKSAGEPVKHGEAVVVMEAMKMEYTLKAGADGRVVEVLCKTDDQVDLGQCLVRLQPEAE